MRKRALANLSTTAALVAVAAAALACSGEKAVEVAPWFAGTPPALGAAPCSEAATPEQKRSLSIDVYVGKGVKPEVARAQIEALRSQLGPYQIELVASSPRLQRVDLDALFSASAAAVDQALARAALDADADPEKVRVVVAELVGRELRDFLAKHAGDKPADLNVVVLSRVVAANSLITQSMPSAAGFTTSLYLADAAAADLNELGVAGGKTPTIFLSAFELGRITPELAMTTAAHEFGHAFGLEHSEAHSNLMAVARSRHCRPVFDARDWGILEAAIDKL